VTVALTDTSRSGIDPIFVTVKQAADALSLSPWTVYQLADKGEIKTQYKGRRRLVLVSSLREYAAALPEYPEQSA
jgi:excisionase family DNA binding protein